MAARNSRIVEPAERELVITRIFDAPREIRNHSLANVYCSARRWLGDVSWAQRLTPL
jgi:hypothetical protein